MIMNLFDEFPSLSDDKIIIGKMSENDVGSLEEITENANVYRYIPPFLYRKSRGNLLAAIRNCGERDFIKKKHIIAGIYLKNARTSLSELRKCLITEKGQTILQSAIK